MVIQNAPIVNQLTITMLMVGTLVSYALSAIGRANTGEQVVVRGEHAQEVIIELFQVASCHLAHRTRIVSHVQLVTGDPVGILPRAILSMIVQQDNTSVRPH